MSDATVGRIGAFSRRVLAQGWLGWRCAGVAKRVVPRLVDHGSILYRDPSGHVLEADLSDGIERAGFFGAHSPGLLRALGHYVSAGDWVIDVGANVGLVTSRLCALAGPTGRVWAVEPLPENVVKLQDLKVRNDLRQLDVLPIALSSENATAGLRLPAAGGRAYGSFVALWDRSGEVEVPTRRLDDLVEQSGGDRQVRFIKIDAEGAEPKVLEGASEVLREMRPTVLCEFNDILLGHAGTSSAALLRQFGELGYRPVVTLGRRHRSLAGRTVDIVLR